MLHVRKEHNMGSQPYILIVIYFVGLATICTLVLARKESARTFQQAQQVEQTERFNISEIKKNAVSYGLLAAVFAFFLVLTIVLQHDTAQHT